METKLNDCFSDNAVEQTLAKINKNANSSNQQLSITQLATLLSVKVFTVLYNFKIDWNEVILISIVLRFVYRIQKTHKYRKYWRIYRQL